MPLKQGSSGAKWLHGISGAEIPRFLQMICWRLGDTDLSPLSLFGLQTLPLKRERSEGMGGGREREKESKRTSAPVCLAVMIKATEAGGSRKNQMDELCMYLRRNQCRTSKDQGVDISSLLL